MRAVAGSRIVYRDGVPLAALEGDYLRPLAPAAGPLPADVASALAGRRMPAVSGGFVGRAVDAHVLDDRSIQTRCDQPATELHRARRATEKFVWLCETPRTP